MVFFTCDRCGESLKKNQVAKHFHNCASHSYSCMDCQKVFDRKTYNDHLKCISENEKYGGKNYVARENKGEVKQNAWTDCVQQAIDNVKKSDRNLQELLIRIRSFSNIPRKEAKFINFLVNSFRIRERALCQRAWQSIEEQVKKMKPEQDKPVENGVQQDGKPSPAKNDESNVEESIENGESNGAVKFDFKWKKSIKRRLKTADDGVMKIKRLRKEVIEEYKLSCPDESVEESLHEIFTQKLESAGVVVEGKIARLA